MLDCGEVSCDERRLRAVLTIDAKGPKAGTFRQTASHGARIERLLLYNSEGPGGHVAINSKRRCRKTKYNLVPIGFTNRNVHDAVRDNAIET